MLDRCRAGSHLTCIGYEYVIGRGVVSCWCPCHADVEPNDD